MANKFELKRALDVLKDAKMEKEVREATQIVLNTLDDFIRNGYRVCPHCADELALQKSKERFCVACGKPIGSLQDKEFEISHAALREKAQSPEYIDGVLEKLVDEYYEFRGYAEPNQNQALLFLVSEVGELADSVVHTQDAWVRNNEKQRVPQDEAADVLMMLLRFCKASGIDLVSAMVSKFYKKGFYEWKSLHK